MGKVRNNILVIIIGFILVCFSGILFAFIESFIPFLNTSTTKNINSNIESNILWLLSPLLLAPIIEEFLFRKWLPAAFADILGKNKSIIFSNGLFAFMHLELYFFPYFVNGLIYAYIYSKSNTIWCPVLVHACYNLLIFILTTV